MNEDLHSNDTEQLETTVSTETPESAVPVRSQLILVGVILLLIFGVGYTPMLLGRWQQNHTDSAAVIDTKDSSAVAPNTTSDPFSDVNINGKAAFVWDVQNQRVLYEKNPDEQLPLASLTKLMTTLVAHELLEDHATVPITVSALQQDGSNGFHNGEIFDFTTLTDLTLITSSNDGAFAIASAAGAMLAPEDPVVTFVDAMNIKANELDLTQTYFRNPTGLDISASEAGAYGSARDIAFLMEYILAHNPELLERTNQAEMVFRNEAGETYDSRNTNHTVSEITGLIGSKTGYTELAGGNLAVAFDASLNRPVITVVLGSTLYGRFADTLLLTTTARKALLQ